MSQRLLLRRSDKPSEHDGVYDCILTELDNDPREVQAKLEKDYFCVFYHCNIRRFLGPWKVFIEDLQIYKQHEVLLKEIFNYFGKEKGGWPECVWQFSFFHTKTKESLWHPTKEQFEEYLTNRKEATK